MNGKRLPCGKLWGILRKVGKMLFQDLVNLCPVGTGDQLRVFHVEIEGIFFPPAFNANPGLKYVTDQVEDGNDFRKIVTEFRLLRHSGCFIR